MLKEGKGITDVVKNDVNIIYNLFFNNSYSSHIYNFGNDILGYRKININFNQVNNYYSNIKINRLGEITLNIGIPYNGKENRIKENIAHELTHIVEILGLNNKEYPKYNRIKKSLIEFSDMPITNAMEYITHIFYKTLDNEVNANVAQTYIYITSEGRCSREVALARLKTWEVYRLYDDIKNINIELIIKNIKKEEIDKFNDLLIKNKVKTISSDDVKKWLEYWFKIFNRKSNIFLKNAERILDEVEKDWGLYESYVDSIPSSDVILNYSNYITNYYGFNKR